MICLSSAGPRGNPLKTAAFKRWTIGHAQHTERITDRTELQGENVDGIDAAGTGTVTGRQILNRHRFGTFLHN